MLKSIPVFLLAIRLAAGHEALDFGSVVRIHDRQLGSRFTSLAVGLAAGHEALDLGSVVRIHDRQLKALTQI
jgi:hypothetical protein